MRNFGQPSCGGLENFPVVVWATTLWKLEPLSFGGLDIFSSRNLGFFLCISQQASYASLDNFLEEVFGNFRRLTNCSAEA